MGAVEYVNALSCNITWHVVNKNLFTLCHYFFAWLNSKHRNFCSRPYCVAQRWSLHAPCVPPLATKPSQRLLHLFGTVCHLRTYATLKFIRSSSSSSSCYFITIAPLVYSGANIVLTSLFDLDFH